MSAPLKAQESYDQDLSRLHRLARVVGLDPQATPSWQLQVRKQIYDLVKSLSDESQRRLHGNANAKRKT